MKPKKLYKTTITIWTDYDPDFLEIHELAHEAISGDAYCDSQNTEIVTNASLFPETEFFDLE